MMHVCMYVYLLAYNKRTCTKWTKRHQTVNNEKNSQLNLKRQRMTNEFLNKRYGCQEGNSKWSSLLRSE